MWRSIAGNSLGGVSSRRRSDAPHQPRGQGPRSRRGSRRNSTSGCHCSGWPCTQGTRSRPQPLTVPRLSIPQGAGGRAYFPFHVSLCCGCFRADFSGFPIFRRLSYGLQHIRIPRLSESAIVAQRGQESGTATSVVIPHGKHAHTHATHMCPPAARAGREILDKRNPVAAA